MVNQHTIPTCFSENCKSHNITFTGFNFQCRDCGSFSCGNIYTVTQTVNLNAAALGVTLPDYLTMSKEAGNDLIAYTSEVNGQKLAIYKAINYSQCYTDTFMYGSEHFYHEQQEQEIYHYPVNLLTKQKIVDCPYCKTPVVIDDFCIICKTLHSHNATGYHVKQQL